MSRFRRMDSFSKIDPELLVKTKGGGILSAAILLILAILLISEILNWRTLKYDYEYLLNPSSHHNTLNVDIDITVAMKCENVRIDIMDVVGTALPIGNTLQKIPVKYRVDDVQDLSAHLLAQKFKHHAQNRPSMGSRAVLVNYNGESDACRLNGAFDITTVKGSFHITPRGYIYADQTRTPIESLNFTHRVDSLSFGKHYTGLVNPLDGTHIRAKSNLDNFQYFVSIVPTIYIDNTATFYNGLIVTNQFAVTEFNHVIDIKNPDNIPGIFIKYDIEPLSVRITQYRLGIIQFITRTSGIIGGVFVTTGLVFRLVKKFN